MNNDPTNNDDRPTTKLAETIPTSQLPFPLTFFLTAAQRAAVLRKLNTLHEDRVTALLMALDMGYKENSQ